MDLKTEEFVEDNLFPQQGFLSDFCSGENHLMFPPEPSFLAAQLQMHQEFDYQQIMNMEEEFQLGLPIDDMLNRSEESPASAGASGASQNEGRTSQDSEQSHIFRRSSPFREWEGFSAAPTTTSCGKFAKKRMLVWIMNCLNSQHEEAKKKMKLHHPSQHQTQHQTQQLQQCNESQNKNSEKHMMAERNRRLKERELKDVLKSLIPSGVMKKKDKNSVYQYTIEYIKNLQDQVETLQEQKNELLEIGRATNYAIDEEVNKSSPSGSFSQTLNPVSSMLIHEDGSRMKLSFDTNGRKLLWIDLLTCLKDMGFREESIDWNPERSSILRLTVRPLMPSAGFVSASQLCERLERKMFCEE